MRRLWIGFGQVKFQAIAARKTLPPFHAPRTNLLDANAADNFAAVLMVGDLLEKASFRRAVVMRFPFDPAQGEQAIFPIVAMPGGHDASIQFRACSGEIDAIVDQQHYDEPPRNPQGALYQPSERIGQAGCTKGQGGREK